MAWRNLNQPSMKEKLIAAACYATAGIAGLLYILLFAKGNDQSQLFRFHFMQSILIWIIATLVGWMASPLLGLTATALQAAVPQQTMAGLFGLVAIVVQVLTTAFYLLLLYGAVYAILGKFAEVPLISRIVRQNMMR